MKPDERIDAAKDLLKYLKEKYPRHTLNDIVQILKIAQSAIYEKKEGFCAPRLTLSDESNESDDMLGSFYKEKLKLLREIIRDIQKTDKTKRAHISDIIRKAAEVGIKKETVESMVQKLKSAGEILESSTDCYRVV